MSAALALAAAACSVGTLRYVGARQRLPNGMAEPGSERLTEIAPRYILERQDIVKAIHLIEDGKFHAAARVFPSARRIPPAGPRKTEIQLLSWAAEFWAAWDRYDFQNAGKLAKESLPDKRPASIRNYTPSTGHLTAINKLAQGIPTSPRERRKDCHALVPAGRWLAAALLNAAERRYAGGRYEEVL